MSGLSSVRFQGNQSLVKPSNVTFQSADKLKEAVEIAANTAESFESVPNEGVIKNALKACMAVAGLFLVKLAPKIKTFIEISSKSPNKVVKVVSYVAAGILTLLSVLGASDLMSKHMSKPEDKATPNAPAGEAKPSEAEPKADDKAPEGSEAVSKEPVATDKPETKETESPDSVKKSDDEPKKD